MPTYDDSVSAYLPQSSTVDGKFKGYISYFRFSTDTTVTSNFVPVTTLVNTAPTANTLIQLFEQDITQQSPLISANVTQISMQFVKQPYSKRSKNYYLKMDYQSRFGVNDIVQITVGNQFSANAVVRAVYNNDITFDTIANLPIDNTGQITITNRSRSVLPKSFNEFVIEPVIDPRTRLKSKNVVNQTSIATDFSTTGSNNLLGKLIPFTESYLPGDYPTLVVNAVANTDPLYNTIQWYTDDSDAIPFASRSNTVFYFDNRLPNDFVTNNQIKIFDGYSTINSQLLASDQTALTINNNDFANVKSTYNLTVASNIASVFPQASVQDFVTPSNPRENLFVQQRRPWTYKSDLVNLDRAIVFANTLARIETLNFTVTKPLYASVPDKSIYFSASNLERNLDLYERRGSDAFTIPGTYLWVAPADVTRVSVVAIGGGGGGSNYSDGGGGGGLGWRNNIPVTPGQLYTVRVGAGGAGADASRQLSLGYNGSDSWFINSGTVAGLGGTGGGRQTGNPGGGFLGDGGGWGGAGGTWTGLGYRAGAGGGGAGGFTSNGGRGGDSHTLTSVPTQATVSLDGGGGGSGAYNSIYIGNYSGSAGGGGGGTGLATGNLRVGITTIVNEGLDPLSGTLQYWTPKTTFYMDQWGGLGPGTAHGHTPNTAFILSIPNLPTHDKIRYQFYWHFVDSPDEETNYLEIDGVRYLQFIKNFYGPGATVINLCQSFTFVTNNTYSYSPWGGNSFGNNGYYIVDTGWIDHSSSSISINHFIGLDGVSSNDEAAYISHATFQISNGFQAIKSPVIVPQQNELFDIEYLVVAGGGGGGSDMGGGGGAGGFRTSVTGATSGGNTAPESLLTTSTSSKLIITVGAGGLGALAGAGQARGSNGSNSSIISSSISIVSIGGGGGASNHDGSGNPAGNGGSGGGASGGAQPPNGGSGGSGGYGGGAAGVGTARQGFNGSFGIYSWYPGGGGGAGGPGSTNVANGGPGLSSGILGTTVFWAGGGAGAGYSGPGGNGGIGGGGGGAVGTTVGGIGYNNGFGGGGGSPNSQTNTPGGRAGVNTGGGGGGGAHYTSNNSGGAGGSGIVILRYPATYYVIADPGLSVYTIAVDGKRVSVFTAGTGSISFTTTPPLTVDYLVVAGGGGGGRRVGGGGGAGGFRTGTVAVNTILSYAVTVGAGGAGAALDSTRGGSGSASLFFNISSAGGGGGGSFSQAAGSGGSGGGGSTGEAIGGPVTTAGGSGNTPSVSPSQGNAGGTGGPGSNPYVGGGGGGAGSVGGSSSSATGGLGGIGINIAISGSLVTYAGGGGGGWWGTPGPAPVPASGGLGGGGAGFSAAGVNTVTAFSGNSNTGGGGGGGGWDGVSAGVNGAQGGSGVVILRYPAAYSVIADPGLIANTIVTGVDKLSIFTSGTGNIFFSQSTGSLTLVAPDLLVTTSGIVVDYLVVAGGGGGGGYLGGGGGGGGLRTSAPQATASGGNSPLEPSLNLANGELYTVVVGAGGPGGANPSNPYFGSGFGRGSNGSISQLASIRAVGGGGGGIYADRSGSAGGSGGGSGGEQSGGGIGGLGTANQGFGGGGTGIGRSGQPSSGSGGGGAGGVGGNNVSGSATAGSGGPGLLNAIDGNNYFYSGGGGGGNYNAGNTTSIGGTGGNGGGGGGGSWGSSGGTPGQGNTTNRGQAGNGTNADGNGTGGAGGPNTGGGGGGAGHLGIGGRGGSGIVIMRYSRQYAQNLQVSSGLTYYTIAVNNLEAVTVFTSGIGTIQFLAGGLGGSGGESGELGINFLNDNQPANGRSGGRYGGGGSGGSDPTSIAGYTVSGGNGANGAVRIVYGTGVSFPSAATLDTTTGKTLISQAEYPKIYSYSNPTKRDMLLISTLVPSLKGRSVRTNDIILPPDNFSRSITTKNNIGVFTLQFLVSAVSRGDVRAVLDVAKTLGYVNFKAVMSETFKIGVTYQGQRIEFFSIQGTKGTQLFFDTTYMKKYPIIFWN